MNPPSLPESIYVLLILLIDPFVVDGLPVQLALSWNLCHMVIEQDFDFPAKIMDAGLFTQSTSLSPETFQTWCSVKE